jgi:hypothetical protein
MKTNILNLSFAVSGFNLALGLVLAGYALFAEGTPRIWRGAMILLVVGAFGLMWFGSALRRRAAEAHA